MRGRHVMKGYWNRPEATAETIVDGWLLTGDIAMIDADGYIYIQDRIKDMIISGGENVYPAEIENVIAGMPGVVEAAVIGVPSEKWGESPLAVVVTGDESMTAQHVLDHCAGKLAAYKQPKMVEFIDVIPRNPTGKVLKRVLREQFPGPAPASSQFRRLGTAPTAVRPVRWLVDPTQWSGSAPSVGPANLPDPSMGAGEQQQEASDGRQVGPVEVTGEQPCRCPAGDGDDHQPCTVEISHVASDRLERREGADFAPRFEPRIA